jgi:hypothetical protein
VTTGRTQLVTPEAMTYVIRGIWFSSPFTAV